MRNGAARGGGVDGVGQLTAVALGRWWARLSRPDRDGARTAAATGVVPDGLLHTLVSAGVVIVSDGYLTTRAPGTVFPMPADVTRLRPRPPRPTRQKIREPAGPASSPEKRAPARADRSRRHRHLGGPETFTVRCGRRRQ